MNGATQENNEKPTSSTSDASIQQLISAWKVVYESFKLKIHTHSDLIAADFRLSLKALVVGLISIFLFVGLALVLWSAMMITMTYGLVMIGLHWGLCAVFVVSLNIGLMLVVKRVLNAAVASISMQATAQALLPP